MSMTTLAPPLTGSPDFGKDLRDTVVSRWHKRLSANSTAKRSHWRTKTVYFRAVASLVAAAPGAPLTWKSIVEAAAPNGSRSTFYEVAGAHARHPLIDAFIDDGRTDSIQLALHYRRTDAVAQLLDEAKVWSYWSHRERMLDAVGTAGPISPLALEAQVCESLSKWSRANPHLAAALGHTPPACAVEDLMLIRDGKMAAVRAASQLTEHLRRAA
ncbi:hypothetical protein ACQP2P_12985 [Dactylosporangium sp. CA-139114]|uniref:hypothetical protein n=1 Tax=Dactylosporangium sp. CA-139114 TaxID=3239931 RepID=UPI003D98F0AB